MNIKEEKYLKNLNHIASNIAIYDVVVDNIDDALEVAMKFKENDEYDWFRGQSGLWPLISTFNRLSVDEQKTMLKKISLLQHWANETLNLQNEDKIIAIAQHYGIPTNFIDFSTDPKTAAFFASNTSDNNSEPNEYSCIICINTQVVSNIIEISKNTTFKNRPHPELLSINVDNLWHLDAQKGKFLYLPMVGFELSLPFKRIIFKRSKQNGSKFVGTDYIPERRSSLEQRFYGYIQMRILSDTTELLEEFVSQVTDMPLIKDEGFDYYKDFVDGMSPIN
ncbi:MAG: FRG domain-containing protein [Sulfurimonas sp.]|nr:FRG domain-containing protein [Sulfurimonas sp.]